jgi:UDP-N-acetylglucosamine--N-acetylmuramyl-(pentapeptide) pyrophosphoryl-undecaprenol N-acetylglucosamine transferase
MTFLIAAAGTGGHVFPGLSVGEGLVELGVPREDILYVGGDRLESIVYPREGFGFLEVELAGLKRSLTLDNARMPRVVMRARKRIADEIEAAGVKAVLGMGGYVTVPAAMAARHTRTPFYNAEQNADAGLANRMTARWANQSFVAFPDTGGLPRGIWVGNPVRQAFWSFDRPTLRPRALQHFGLSEESPVVGVFGGSLGAQVINEAVASMVAAWPAPPIQVVHLTGAAHVEAMSALPQQEAVDWKRLGFEASMDLFFAAVDVVIARAGGAVAEITATGTPSILVPGKFGSGGHQEGNARFLSSRGAAVVVEQDDIGRLSSVVRSLLADDQRLARMSGATSAIAKPDAALTIARAMIEAVE